MKRNNVFFNNFSFGGMEKRYENTMQVHQAVLDAGEEETGCTIHEVTEQVDGGPILIQKKVKVRALSEYCATKER